MAISSHPENSDPSDPQLAFVPLQIAKQWRESLTDERMKKRAQPQT